MDENTIEMINKVIDNSKSFVEQANEVNKKFVHAFVACIGIMAVLIGFIVIVYFTSSYDYGIISQYQDGGTNQSIEMGSD